MKNLRIAICEDDKNDSLILEYHLLALDKNSEIHLFDSSEAFLNAFTTDSYDIIFFDVYMSGMTGMEAAKLLRKIDSEVSVVFTTTSEDFALESYKVSALHYIIKPVSFEDVTDVAERYKRYTELSLLKKKLILKGESTPVLLRDIMYIEVFGRELHIHTVDATIVSSQLLGSLQQQLPTLPFLHCHRAYIVNLDYVSDIEVDFIMDNGDKVYIRKRDYSRIRDAYFAYLLKTL